MNKRRTTNIQGMPVMQGKCKTCPFGKNGCQEVRRSVESRLLEVSQTCHSTGVALNPPRQDTHICRGARDWQIEFFHSIGFLDEPTDEAWRLKLESITK